jgi:hypothetical protein
VISVHAFKGVEGLEGKLKEDFMHMIQQHRRDISANSAALDREDMCMCGIFILQAVFMDIVSHLVRSRVGSLV